MGAQAKSQDPPTAEDAAKGGPRRAVLRRERPRYLKRKIAGRKREEEIERKEERKERVKNTTKRTNLHVFTFTLGARCTLYVEAEAPFLFSRVKILRLLHSLYTHTLHRRIAGTVFEKDVESRESRAVCALMRQKQHPAAAVKNKGDMRHEVHFAFTTLAPLERAPLLTCCGSFFSFVLW